MYSTWKSRKLCIILGIGKTGYCSECKLEQLREDEIIFCAVFFQMIRFFYFYSDLVSQ